jgi:hypothetical protein
MATILGWTLEINPFFISMFGNTLTFSKLPLRDILLTQKDIMTKFIAVCNNLYEYSCKLNADQKYKWHKNLNMAENEHRLARYHIENCISIIAAIESEHLDYDAQMRRLQDVMMRFQPFMTRVDASLPSIQSELDIEPRRHRIAASTAHALPADDRSMMRLTVGEEHTVQTVSAAIDAAADDDAESRPRSLKKIMLLENHALQNEPGFMNESDAVISKNVANPIASTVVTANAVPRCSDDKNATSPVSKGEKGGLQTPRIIINSDSSRLVHSQVCTIC